MKKIFTLLLLIPIALIAQDINIGAQGASLYDCSTNGQLYDSGGSGGSYGAGESFVLVVCANPPPPAGTPIAFEYVSSNFGHPNDFMAIYDGAGTVASTDLLYSFSQTSAQAVGSIYRTTISNASGCITVQFISDAASPGGDIEFNLLCLPPCKSVVANMPTTSIAVQPLEPTYIHSCDDSPITFSATGTYDATPTGYTQSDATSQFYWDFGSAGYDTGQVVNTSFLPGIYPIKLIVEDIEGCQSVNEIDLSVRQTLIPDVHYSPTDSTLCINEMIDLSAFLITTSGQMLFVGDTALFDTLKVQTSVSIQDTAYLPDDADGITGNGITTPAVFEFPIFGYQPGATLQNVNDLFYVCIDLEHSFIGDLDILIECPNGQTTALVDFNPPGNALGSNFGEPVIGTTAGEFGVPYTYCWSPAANPTDSIAQGNAGLVILANGAVDTSINYYPQEGDWDGLLGCPLNGNWSIQVFDDYGSDDGYVFGAAIEFDGSFALNPDTFFVAYDNPLWDASPQILTALDNDSIGVITNTVPFETLTFNFDDNLGCDWSYDYDGITVSTIDVNNFFKDTSICSADTLSIFGDVESTFASCDYFIEMRDSFPDSWNGNEVNIFADGVLIGSFTVDFTENDYSLESFSVLGGQTIEIEYDNSSGSFNTEVSFAIIDASGNEIFMSDFDPQPGIVFTTIADCYSGYTFNWSSDNGTIVGQNSNQAQVYATTNSEFYLNVVNEYGCEANDTSTIIFDGTNVPLIDFSTAPVLLCCTGTELSIDLSSYVSGPTISQTNVNNVAFGNNPLVVNVDQFTEDTVSYNVTYLSDNGCSATEEIEFYRNCINPSIEVFDSIFVGDSKIFSLITENTFSNMTYEWTTTDNSDGAITDPNVQNAEFNGVFENQYIATGTATATFDQNNGAPLVCAETAETMPYEVVDILELRYPDAFSPNADERNNIFRPIMSQYGQIEDFRIYNEWGDIVYDISKSDNKEGWDGKFKEKDQAPGLYIYFITIRNFDELIKTEGSVNLLR